LILRWYGLYERVVPEMTIDLDDVRSLEPSYSGMPDSMLADTLYTTYFSDLPRTTFDQPACLETGRVGPRLLPS